MFDEAVTENVNVSNVCHSTSPTSPRLQFERLSLGKCLSPVNRANSRTNAFLKNLQLKSPVAISKSKVCRKS